MGKAASFIRPRSGDGIFLKRGPATRRTRRSLRRTLVVCCGVLLSGAAIIALGIHFGMRPAPRLHPVTLVQLLALPPARVVEIPILELNLLSATGLSPTNEPDFQGCAATLAAWAARVRSETERHQYRFERNPGEFENSPGFFRMLMLCVVLEEDYGIQYDPQRRAGPAVSSEDDGFFADSTSVFLHGLLGPERKGTCSSLPVLYVAVGRQLGYPLKLVTTRGHLFVRWDGQGERFNVEATSRGLSRFDDDYYRHWPFELTPAEEAAEGYLKSLTPAEELGVFLSIRGMCLRDQRRFSEAAKAFAAATHFAPHCRSYGQMLSALQSDLARNTERSGLPLKSMSGGAQN